MHEGFFAPMHDVPLFSTRKFNLISKIDYASLGFAVPFQVHC